MRRQISACALILSISLTPVSTLYAADTGAPAPAPVVTKAKEVDYQHLTKAEKRILDQKQYDLKRA